MGNHTTESSASSHKSPETENDGDFRVHVFSSSSELLEKLHEKWSSVEKQPYPAMYSSIYGGIILDPAMMVIPIDDHMVHRGHGVFDTAIILDGYLYELDVHLDRFLRSASKAKIPSPFPRSTLRSILIQLTAASKCKKGTLRYWLSAVLEAEEKGAFASIWVDEAGYIAEGPNVNVAFITQEKELIMPLFDSILYGCTAKRLLELAPKLVDQGLLKGVTTRNLSVEEAKAAAEMMYVGSTLPVLPIIMWDDQPIGNGMVGELTMLLSDLLWDDMVDGPDTQRIPVPYVQ
ncbi:Aminotransferase-like, PLP-dependent enzyme [Sesbania bispinosa]|nr:Aminotransferase-like, PLP-dependent enzyme [Sesbania bispinosa]